MSAMIDENLINSVERDFLPDGMSFDEERRRFITKMVSCDLQAVPGSGKTTALQAKLACLMKAGVNGVLVLSHTNAAVDEIKKNLVGEYARIFSYPNCVCTVQEFVDKYLALPYYENVYKHSVIAIDSDAYNDYLEKLWNILYDLPSNRYVKSQINPNELRLLFKDASDYIVCGMENHLLQYNIPQTWHGQIENNKRCVNQKLLNLKLKILRDGFLHYDDCYYLANKYLDIHHGVADMLRKRFPFVFIDETQDLQTHQLQLIDRIFNNPACSLQRIGDINQAIYSNTPTDLSLWVPRNVLYLQNSLRLTREIATVVNAFTLDSGGTDEFGNPLFVVNGIRRNRSVIPPVLVLYDEQSKSQLRIVFNHLIDEYQLRDTTEAKKYGFHIIGWNAVSTEGTLDKVRLIDLFPDCSLQREKKKLFFDTLSDYIQCGRTHETLGECQKSVLSVLCRVSRILDVRDNSNRHYILSNIKNLIPDVSKVEFEKTIYSISQQIVIKNYESAYSQLSDFIRNKFLPLLDKAESEDLKAFIGEEFLICYSEDKPLDKDDITVGTVHSVKGMTHCATMYVETFYYDVECNHVKVKNGKDRGKSLFFRDSISLDSARAKSAMKMLYVGMSRPTHLLAYASQFRLWGKSELSRMESLGWRVICVQNDGGYQEMHINMQ